MQIIRIGFKQKTFGMPLAALCANLVWETLMAFVYPPTGLPPLQQWISNITMHAWILLDLGILYTWIRWWDTDFFPKINPIYRWPILIYGLATSAGIIIGMQQQFGNPTGAVYASFAQALMMALLFIMMYSRRGGSLGQSRTIAWCMLIGNVCAAIYWYMRGETGLMMVSLYVALAIANMTYVVVLTKDPADS